MVLDSVLPVFLVIASGAFLKRLGFTGDGFHKVSDRLVYYIFFPVLLFWKIGDPAAAESMSWRLNLSVLAAILTVYLLSLALILAGGVPRKAAGSFSQACYRFNTYVGLAIVVNVLGEEGMRYFGTLISFAIPFINVLAVWTLIRFSDAQYTSSQKTRFIAKSMLSNPLILACLSGLLYARFRQPFPGFLENTFRLLAPVTLPLALLSIGASLNFRKIGGLLKLSAASCLFKIVLLPLAGLFYLHRFGVTGVPFQTAMIFFSLPAATAIYILSSQFDSDLDMASASILLSTLLSFFSLSASLLLFVH